MRILFTIPYFRPATSFGGPVTVASELCTELASRGHQISVLTNDFGVEIDRTNCWQSIDGYKVYHQKTGFFHRIAPYPNAVRRTQLESMIKDSDVVHVHVGLTHFGHSVLKIASQLDVPTVYSPHGCLCRFKLKEKRLSKKWFIRIFERSSLRLATKIHALTKKEQNDSQRLTSLEDSKFEVIPNGLRSAPLPKMDTREIKTHLGIPSNNAIVLFLSRISWIKGLDILVDAVDQFREELKSCTFVIAGSLDGDFGSNLKGLISEKDLQEYFRLVGHLEGQQKIDTLAAASCFVLPSYSEGLPMAVLESLQHGVPCLISTRCNLPEIETSGCGFVFEPVSEKLGLSLIRIMRSSLESYRQNARALFRDKFRIEDVVTKFESLYDSSLRVRNK